MASPSPKTKSKQKQSLSVPNVGDVILHEGWCVKESGTAFLGHTNWRKRWFRLLQRSNIVTLQYFRSRNDRIPAGSVKLDVTYCTHQVESHEKPQPNCFAVGPLVDDGSIRTYYISCQSELAMQEWMAVIDAAIQGVPEQAQRRRQTINHQYSLRHQRRQGRGKSSLDSIGESLEARGLDLSTSVQLSGEIPVATVDTSLERDDLSDDEVWEIVEDDVVDEEEWLSWGASAHSKASSPDSVLQPASRLRLYENQGWRMEHWRELCHTVRTTRWNKIDTREGVTVARCKFGRSSKGHAVIKVEGVLPADPSTVYQFLQLSTREGGKLDYIFRNETVLQELEDEPAGVVIYNEFLLPIPRVSRRDIVAMKFWVPEILNQDGSSGFVMFSVDHPDAPPLEKDTRRINVNSSGLVLTAYPGPGREVHTHAVILMQVAFYGALHRMLKGAYNSGLLKLGLRSTFIHIAEQLQRFVEITNF